MDLKCLCCENEFEGTISKDEMGWHSVCVDCGSSFDVDVPEGRIVVAFANPDYDAAEPYKVFEQERPEENICSYYVFATPQEFINKWYEMVEDPDGMWYWVIDNEFEYANGEKGVALITSGACDSGDIEFFRDSWRIGTLEEELDAFFEEVEVAPEHATLTMKQREKAKMLHQELTYDDMSKSDMALIVKYEVEQYKMKADKLFAEGWCPGFVGDIIQAWWDDYRMADGTATALFRYVEEKGKELAIRKSRGNGPLAVEAMMAFKAEAEAVLHGRGLNDVLTDASDRASATSSVGREIDLEKY